MELKYKQTYNGSCVDLEKELGLNRGDVQQIEATEHTMIITVKDGVDTEGLDEMLNPNKTISKLKDELADLKKVLTDKKVI